MDKAKSPPGYSCGKCKNLDNSQMVMCDRCDKWYHFTCVGVDSSVADYNWNCDICEPIPSSTSTANIVTVSSVQPNSTSSPTSHLPAIATTTAVTSICHSLALHSRYMVIPQHLCQHQQQLH
ncbi:hypothetical protein EVAR_74116_1 [Eumeta japonica]|uniref:PHD-type domain-containing protein n=1 Tax=Eumeta variegata TaxID=151549 RepID=A0A4C1TU31_EUMVA|nr:hypothetical protein EVAR_74116_1 [Eumeta japonica]